MGVRCFIAIVLPPAAKDYAARLISLLARRLPSGAVRFSDPRQLHLTLHFLGDDVSDATVAAVCSGGLAVAASVPTFTLTLDGLGTLPTHGPPRVIIVPGQDVSGGLLRLRQAFGELISAEKIALDHRAWQPHLTLGRVQGAFPLPLPNTAALPKHAPITTAAFHRSTLTPDGPHYARLATFPLNPHQP